MTYTPKEVQSTHGMVTIVTKELRNIVLVWMHTHTNTHTHAHVRGAHRQTDT